MSRMLNLVDQLLEKGRHLQRIGRSEDAVRVLTRLASLHELPAPIAEEAQSRLAELYMRCGRFGPARRHLGTALVHQPKSAQYHHLMATALEADEKADPFRALEHYRASLELDPEQPRCLSEYGLLALSLGLKDEALPALRKAAELATDEPEILGNVTQGLCEAGQLDEARELLRAAQFRHPRDARYRVLWDRLQFDAIQHQQAERRQDERCRGEELGSMLLPFVRSSELPLTGGNPRRRRDAASPLKPPHLPRFLQMPGRKHA